jgi:hypothetical protein
MTSIDQAPAATTAHRARTSTRPPGRRRPGPFPVTIVAPARVTPQALTPDQRERQRATNQMAHRITDASREGIHPHLGGELTVSLHRHPDIRGTVATIIGDAPGLATDPPTGAVRVGRNNRGRVVVIVLHTAAWSLLLRPAQPHPAVWTFLDDFGGLPIRFHNGGALLRTQWTDMADAVFTTLNT